MLLNVLLAAAAILSAIGTIMMWLEARSSRKKDGADDQVGHQISDAIAPVTEKLSLLTQKLTDHIDNEAEVIRAAVERGVHPLVTQVEVLEEKVKIFWKDVALSSARVIHQPDPRRRHIDNLIEAFTAAVEDPDAHFSPEQLEELKDYLEKIRDWEPGQWVGFPVVQGEQAAAVTLLHTMEHALDAPDPGPQANLPG